MATSESSATRPHSKYTARVTPSATTTTFAGADEHGARSARDLSSPTDNTPVSPEESKREFLSREAAKRKTKTLRAKVFEQLDDPSSSTFSKNYSIAMMLIIVIATLCFVLESEATAETGILHNTNALVPLPSGPLPVGELLATRITCHAHPLPDTCTDVRHTLVCTPCPLRNRNTLRQSN